MAQNALVSAGTAINIKVGDAFIKIAGITDFSGLGSGSAAVIDVSDLDSQSKEKLMGTPDEGSFSLSMHYLPTDAGQNALDAARTSRELTDFEVVKGTVKFAFSGFVPTFEKGGTQDQAWNASATIEISGPIVKTVTGA